MLRQLALILLALLTTVAAHAAEEQRFSVPLGSSPAYGGKDAPVTIVEFIDYQ